MCGVFPRHNHDLIGVALVVERLQVVRDGDEVDLGRASWPVAPVAKQKVDWLSFAPTRFLRHRPRWVTAVQREAPATERLLRMAQHWVTSDPVERGEVVEWTMWSLRAIRIRLRCWVERISRSSASSTAAHRASACGGAGRRRRWAKSRARAGLTPTRIFSIHRHRDMPTPSARVPDRPRRRAEMAFVRASIDRDLYVSSP